MHDLFDIVGLSRSAPPVEARRVFARAIRRAHPDFRRGGAPVPTSDGSFDGPGVRPARRDAAVDFVDMSVMIDRMQAAFFMDCP